MHYLITIYGDESGWADTTPEQASETDGPFAETREQLGGYYLLDCKDLDEAISWAARIPGALTGACEVRPVMDYEATGAAEAHATTEGAA